MTMPMKVRQKAALGLRPAEVNGKHAAAGPEHASSLNCALFSRLPREMVQHQRT